MRNKVTIIGAGWVGSTAAYSLIASNITEEIAIIDINKKLAESQVMDLQHSVPFWGYTRIKVGTYKDVADSGIVVVCCGVGQKPGQTRMDLIKSNSVIMKDILPKIFKKNPDVVVLIVTNPVDVLTYQAVKMFPKKKKQIIGSGTILDSARFRFLLGEYLEVDPKSVHAYIVGEHGDSELPLWSTATVGNTSLDKFKKIPAKIKKEIFEEAKNAAYTIIEGKQATYYAIGAGIEQIVDTVLFNNRTVFPVSYYFEGEYGIKDVCLSLPVVLGRKGIIKKINITGMSSDEKKLLQKSAKKIRETAKKI